jgi:chromosome segregation ATPase
MSALDSVRRGLGRLRGQRESTEDERLVALFRNRAELKKELHALDDERHRLLDRLKLQEGATMRVEEQLATLERYLGRPEEGLKCLAYYQLRAVWRVASARVEQFGAELVRQQKDRERREQLAAFEAKKRDRFADVDRELVEARVLADQLQAEQQAAERRLASLNGFWNHFRRKRLADQITSRQARIDAALTQVTDLSDQRHEVESEPPPAFEGMSRDGRRAINLAVIAYAEALFERLSGEGFAELVRESMLRRVYDANYGGPAECNALIRRATGTLAELDRIQDDLADLKIRSDRLRRIARYRGEDETVPLPDSLEASGVVLLEEYWEVYKALVR